MLAHVRWQLAGFCTCNGCATRLAGATLQIYATPDCSRSIRISSLAIAPTLGTLYGIFGASVPLPMVTSLKVTVLIYRWVSVVRYTITATMQPPPRPVISPVVSEVDLTGVISMHRNIYVSPRVACGLGEPAW